MKANDPTIREEHHFHSCIECGNIWDHDPPPHGTTHEEFIRMHSCAYCGSKRNCAIACANRTEAEEFATHGYITIDGEAYYAPETLSSASLLAALLKNFGGN